MTKYHYMSEEGYSNLKEQLAELKTNGRRQAAQAIADARDKGDLSENAEYDAAKNAQGMLEFKINELEHTLANAKIIDKSKLDASKAVVLSKVKILNTKTRKEMIYQLVSASEADLKQKKLSVSSPLGEGLLGKAVGEKAEIQTPGGLMTFEILDISL